MSSRRLADQVYAQIVEIISGDNLQIGERLPSEPALAAKLSVSRAVIREALVRLESDGLTETRRGSGSYVTRRPSSLLSNHLPLDQMAVAIGTYEVRFVLEAEAARLAALRHTPGDMALISECLARLRSALMSKGPADDEDMALHRAIMNATGNEAFVSTFDGLHNGISQVMKAGVEISRSRSPAIIQMMFGEHEDIVDAIRRRDGDRSALAMRWHLSQGRRRLMP